MNRRVLSMFVTAVALLLAVAVPASAGDYLVYSCKTPGGKLAPTDGWTIVQTPGAGGSATNTCPTGGVIGASLFGTQDQPAGAEVGWQFSAPPNTTIDYFNLWRSTTTVGSSTDLNSTPTQYTAYPSAAFNPDGREWCDARQCPSRGVNTSQPVKENNIWSGQLDNINDVFFIAGCVGTAPCAARTTGQPMVDLRIQGLQVSLRDEANPTADEVRGALVESGPHRGTEAIRFNAHDTGSGLYKARVELKRQGASAFDQVLTVPVDTNDGKCVELDYWPTTEYEFGYRVPCKLSAAPAIDLDTAGIADGEYEMQVVLDDAAGNESVVYRNSSFTIDNRAPSHNGSTGPPIPQQPPGPNGENASDHARLDIVGAHRRTVGYGHSTKATLALHDEAGRPITHATVSMMERMRVRGARWTVSPTLLRTDARGRLETRLPFKYSRVARFVYMSGLASTPAASTTLQILARSHTTLRKSRSFLRNGQTLRFSGRLLSAPVPDSGVVIDLQARVGSRWVSFKTVRSDSQGRWRGTYRFRATSGLQTYRFRARVRKDSGYPYVASTSKRVRVRVRG